MAAFGQATAPATTVHEFIFGGLMGLMAEALGGITHNEDKLVGAEIRKPKSSRSDREEDRKLGRAANAR
ncbi:hypothetical protein V8E53_000169 [Lactarius tabidus]